MTARRPFRGLHYRSGLFYSLADLIKRGRHRDQRFMIAATYVRPETSVLDFCAGTGRLKRFIPESCRYTAIEASSGFCALLKKRRLSYIQHDLHQRFPELPAQADVAVMLISLAQFRDTSADTLLEGLKVAARQVVIVEEVLSKPRPSASVTQKTINYLCAADYYTPVSSWFTREEFVRLVTRHGYLCQNQRGRYSIAVYGKN